MLINIYTFMNTRIDLFFKMVQEFVPKHHQEQVIEYACFINMYLFIYFCTCMYFMYIYIYETLYKCLDKI
jgi:hypothetical protein